MNPKKDIHMIGHAHLDPAWFWPWTEGMSEIKSTFKAAVDRLEEFPVLQCCLLRMAGGGLSGAF